ncbi:MAG: hypothetical protein NTW87_15595 [Planctomycetota bacterium]|nr:hypothetical protein [Planctomycetota bacterium]
MAADESIALPVAAPPEKRGRFRTPLAGCCLAAGGAILLLTWCMWEMLWGFAGLERDFVCRFHFGANSSGADIVICPLEHWPARFAVQVLIGSAFVGFGVLLVRRRFSLHRSDRGGML